MTAIETSSSNKKVLVKATNIGVKRGKRWIFRNVDFQIKRGEVVFLIGANGAGKSTCTKVALGLIQPTEGSIERTLSKQMGYVPQRLAIAPTLPLTLHRMMTLTGKFSAQDVDAALAQVGLDRLGNPPVHTLSGGEFQRLLLARAMLHRPEFLVLDEPDQGIDTAGATVLYSLIEQLRKNSNCGILLVSHSIERVMDYGDDIIVLVPHEYDDRSRNPNHGA